MPDPSLLELREKIPHSFKLGDLKIFPNVFLSPMSGVTDLMFREIISSITNHRCGMLVSEFISVEGMTRLIPKTCRQMRFTEAQRPFVIQIFGAEINRMVKAAIMCEEAGADAVEINCGCPAPKVVRKGGGSGLLLDLSRYRRIIQGIVSEVKIPVSVKVRIGFSDQDINVKETHHIAQEEGAQLFIIHGRTRNQGYKGLSNWEIIGGVAANSKIPVVGNGDILTVEDVVNKIHTYGVAGVSLGRGAMHNPWIFRQVLDFYEGREPADPDPREYIDFFHTYRECLVKEFQFESGALGRLKQIAARIVKGYPGSAVWRKKLLLAPTLDEFEALVGEYYGGLDGAVRDLRGIRDLNGRAGSEIEQGVEYAK